MRAPVGRRAVTDTRSQRTGDPSARHGAPIQRQWSKHLGTVWRAALGCDTKRPGASACSEFLKSRFPYRLEARFRRLTNVLPTNFYRIAFSLLHRVAWLPLLGHFGRSTHHVLETTHIGERRNGRLREHGDGHACHTFRHGRQNHVLPANRRASGLRCGDADAGTGPIGRNCDLTVATAPGAFSKRTFKKASHPRRKREILRAPRPRSVQRSAHIGRLWPAAT